MIVWVVNLHACGWCSCCVLFKLVGLLFATTAISTYFLSPNLATRDSRYAVEEITASNTMAPWLTVVGTLVLCGLVSGVAGQSANSQGDCSTIDVSYQVADIKPKSLRRRGRGETHVAVTNHKTGTVLSFCICTSLPLSKCIKSEGHDGSEFRIGTYGINFARDPFRIMASAYFYHLNTTESWANAPIQQSYHDGVTQALRAYNAWCHPDKPEISMDRTSTFSTVMRSLPMKYGLILEALMLVDVNM